MAEDQNNSLDDTTFNQLSQIRSGKIMGKAQSTFLDVVDTRGVLNSNLLMAPLAF